MPNIINVHVASTTGDTSFLNSYGIGTANVNAQGEITSISCGVFAQQDPLPEIRKKYIITGQLDYPDGRKVDFKVTKVCTAAARPRSTFA